ncbi:MAG: DUF667 domain-containing protein, partial [Dehalococcoidia bacterium]|nr:DUF667 domain-containing protein [Dehalococcoidia bacterium]
IPTRQKVTAEIDVRKLPARGNFRLKLDPFAIVKESRLDNNEVRLIVPEVATVVLDNFEYGDPPINHGWSVQDGQGSMRVVSDKEAASRVLDLSSQQGLSFRVNYPLAGQTLGIPRRFLRMRFRSDQDFQLFVRVTSRDGHEYYLMYTTQEAFPSYQTYIIYSLGATAKDGKWHLLERDLDADLRGLFSRVEYFVLRGSVRVDDLTLSNQSSSGR